MLSRQASWLDPARPALVDCPAVGNAFGTEVQPMISSVSFGDSESGFVGLDGDGMNRQQAAQRGQQCMGLVPCHLHFPARHVGKFVENLHAD